MTARKRKAPGGRRKGAGRPPLGAKARSVIVTIKLTPAEHRAVKARIEDENANVKDGTPATVSSWFRDHGLDPVRMAWPEGGRPGESTR